MEKHESQTFEKYQETLNSFCAENYTMENSLPLHLCFNAIQGNLEGYAKYEEQLFRAAEEKGVLPQCKEKWNDFSKQLRRVRAVLSLINTAEHDQETEDKVNALAIMCGIGKSTAIGYKIQSVIERNDGHGLLVLTDKTERLYEYIQPKNNPALCEYFRQHKGNVTVKEQENLSEANRTQDKTPVLIMTTQRFFSLTREEVKRYLKWEGGDRPLIIIDERPPLREIINITRREINNVASALADGVNDSADQGEKQWCREQWEIVRSRLNAVIEGFENSNCGKKAQYSIYKRQQPMFTEDDPRFFRFIRKNIRSLKQYDHGDALKQLKAIYRIEMWGSIYQSEKGGRYSNKFSMMIDNKELLQDIGAKVIILDGTATIHPDYKQDFIHVWDANSYPDTQRTLKGLSLHFVHVSTSKLRIVQKDHGNTRKQLIAEHIMNLKPPTARAEFEPKDIPIFTYSNIENYFLRNGFKNVHHFGNIKGSNDFKDHHLLVQIGLHRCDPFYYLTYDLYNRSEQIKQLLEMPDDQGAKYVNDYVSNQNGGNSVTMYSMILEDVEQNFFRSAIRSSNESGDIQVDYWIYCNTKYHADLMKMAKDRYEPLDAKIVVHGAPRTIKLQKALERNVKEETTIQKFLKWLDTLPAGHKFTRAEAIKGAGISGSSFDHMREPASPIYDLMIAMSIKKGLYQKL